MHDINDGWYLQRLRTNCIKDTTIVGLIDAIGKKENFDLVSNWTYDRYLEEIDIELIHQCGYDSVRLPDNDWNREYKALTGIKDAVDKYLKSIIYS